MTLIFYGCARKHRIKPSSLFDNIIYNDIEEKFYCNITADVRDLIKKPGFIRQFDALIFTPPCNYYSRANYRRETSLVSQETKDLLPLLLNVCVESGKWFIVENVQNSTFFKDLYPYYQFVIGGHTFWSNLLDYDDFFDILEEFEVKQNKQNVCRNKRDGNKNVDLVLSRFVDCVPVF